MHARSLFSLTVLIIASVSASDVVTLTVANFDEHTKATTGDNGSWLVEFYAPWCGHCKKLQPIWEELATNVKGSINVAKVDVTDNRDLGTRFGIKGFPTVKFFHEGSVYDYKGARTVAAFKEFVTDGFTKTEGTTGVVRDSYQRVCLRLSVQEFMEDECFNKLQEYVGGFNLRHIFIEFDISMNNLCVDVNLSAVQSSMSVLQDMTLPEEKLVFTCEIVNYTTENDIAASIIDYLSPTVIVVRRLSTRDSTVEAISSVGVILEQQNSKHIHIGVSGLELDEVQYCLDAKRGVIKFICMGAHQYPNLKVHHIELAHSRGCNTMLTISDVNPEKLSRLDHFAAKYKRHQAVVLAKIILQLGALVAFDCGIDSRFICSRVSKLCHPFTHLQLNFAPSDEYRFVISNDDMSCIYDASLENEFLEENKRIDRYVLRPESRTLRTNSMVAKHVVKSQNYIPPADLPAPVESSHGEPEE